MTGHGSPRTSPCDTTHRMRLPVRLIASALLLCLMLSATGAAAAEQTFRIRLAWGGGEPRQWQGEISVRGGSVTELTALGIEADEPGSTWIEHRAARIQQRSPRSYDGCDLTITVTDGALLSVKFWTAEDRSPPVPVEIPVANLVRSQHNSELDQQGNRLLVVRRPGDTLRVQWGDRRESEPSENLILWAGESLRMSIHPHLLGVATESSLRLSVSLSAAGSEDKLWSDEQFLTAPAAGAPIPGVPLSVPLPQSEGVYELAVVVQHAGFRERFLKNSLAQRKVQLVVLEKNPAAAPLRREQLPVELEEIDPASPSWWERLRQVPLIPGLRRGPLNNEHARPREHSLGTLVELPANVAGEDVHWEAYPLPVKNPGTPHILEVDLPADVAQSIGISIVESNAAGAVMPIGLDSGVYRPPEAIEAGNRWSKHRIVFWPRTKTPMVLMTNRHASAPAVFGKFRLLRYDGRLPTAHATDEARPERLLGGYYRRPLFAENFSASQSLDASSGRSLDDWVTFYQGATRLVDYLNYTGRNGLMLSVLADGSTIYPSQLLQPTPRYDTGTFFASGQDPVRKDVLELLFRLFDREGLQLIPAVHFTAPLPELEHVKRLGGPQSIGLEWVGADGKAWLEVNRPRRGQAPYYNALNSRVQQAMLGVIRELADRYGHHPSFGGLAVALSADGYAQLPGARWGYDDNTIAQYERAQGVRVAGAGPGRFGVRDKILSGEQRKQWLRWRAESLATFHRRIQAEIAVASPGARLYLPAAESLSGPLGRHELRPGLTQNSSVEKALLAVGIEPANYVDQEDVVLIRPYRVTPLDALFRQADQAVDLAINQATNMDRRFAEARTTASLFHHEPRQGRLASFETKSPFQPTYCWQVAQLSPAGSNNRRRFAHALAALDAEAMFDGGWLLPMGQEDALSDWVDTYRRLPAGKFQTLNAETQPVTIRLLHRDDRTYVYLVNDSPWSISVNMRVAGPTAVRLEGLGTKRPVPPLRSQGQATTWSVRLEPYDLVGARFMAANVELLEPSVQLDPAVVGQMRTRIQGLWQRAPVLRKKRPIDGPENAGFELKPDGTNSVPGWVLASKGKPEATVTRFEPHSGNGSVRFVTDGQVASFWSGTFEPPRTGRLALSVWLRVPDATRQPSLRLAVEGRLDGETYYRHAKLGAGSDELLGPEWDQFIFPVPELPLEGLTDLRVRFDMMGPGEVWIDDVELSESAFSNEELMQLSLIINLASGFLEKGKVRDAYHVLQTYWPRFLEDRVEAATVSLTGRSGMPAGNASSNDEQSSEAPGFFQGLRDRLVPKFLR